MELNSGNFGDTLSHFDEGGSPKPELRLGSFVGCAALCLIRHPAVGRISSFFYGSEGRQRAIAGSLVIDDRERICSTKIDTGLFKH